MNTDHKNETTLACEALERAITELKEAGRRAKADGNRAAERNLGENKVYDLEVLLRTLRSYELYIIQPMYRKYFVKENNEQT